MSAPKGLGLWIWILRHCNDGEPGEIVDRCKRSGVSWVTIKSGDSDANGQVTRGLVEALRAGGLGVYTWNYSIPGTCDRQIAQIDRLYTDVGVDGHFLDAEIEWEQHGDRRAEARDFMRRLRGVIGSDRWLAHAPWWLPTAHPTYPWAEFGEATDAQCPQVYWTMLPPEQSGRWMIDYSEVGWERLAKGTPGAVSLRSPIGSVFHGDHRNGVKNGQIVRPEDVEFFLARCETHAREVPFWSLYSYDACPPEIWAHLESRVPARSPPTSPSTAAA